MTTRELRNDVSALSFCDIGEKDGRFTAYANLALRTIYKELTFIGTHTVYIGGIRPSHYTERILHKGGESESVPLLGKAYSFLAVGKGSITVSDGYSEFTRDFDTEGTAFRGFLHSEGKLTLTGDYSFTVFSLAVFSEIVSEFENDIPLISRSHTYNMRDMVNDFQSFLLPPKDGNGKEIPGAVFSDGILTIPDYTGDKIIITYRRLPKKIYIDFPDSQIDLSEEYSDLLTVLCAYFICLEDDRESAERYRELYNSILQSHKKNSPERTVSDLIVTNGWA